MSRGGWQNKSESEREEKEADVADCVGGMSACACVSETDRGEVLMHVPQRRQMVSERLLSW